MRTHRDLSPWLSGLFVTPAARGQGVASALVRHLVERSTRIGIDHLYLYTSSARGLYERLGWRAIVEDQYDDRRVTIMTIDCSLSSQDREVGSGEHGPIGQDGQGLVAE